MAATEQNKTLEVLQTAIQMETDGKAFYLEISQQSKDRLGRELLRSLAAEEDIHRRKFEEIYAAIRAKKGWPQTDFRPDGGKHLRTIFAKAIRKPGSKLNIQDNEVGAIQAAIDMESRSYDFYKSQSQSAIYDAEKRFYEILAAEEREHHLILLDYREYLKDPAAWFAGKEHPSLDGG